MSEGLQVRVDRPFDQVVTEVRAALAGQGFGVLTEIDVKATMKAKLDEDLEEFLILGACNPPLALRAINAHASIGTFLPCNVVVRREGDRVLVEAVDPQTMVQVSGEPALEPIAADATERLRVALASLA